MANRKGLPIWALWLLPVAGVVAIVVATIAVLPWSGNADPTVNPRDVADLAFNVIQYLQTLATAVFALALLLLSRKLVGAPRAGDTERVRHLVAVGVVLLGLSLVSGFLNLELLVVASTQRLLLDKMLDMHYLRIVQSMLLLLGVFAIGGGLLSDILRGGSVVPERH